MTGDGAATRQSPNLGGGSSSVVEAVALKPCPFCGSSELSPIESVVHLCHNEWHPEFNQRGDSWTVQCDHCTATMGQFDDPDEAMDAWNTRAITSHNSAMGEVTEAMIYEAAKVWDRWLVTAADGQPELFRDIYKAMERARLTSLTLEQDSQG